MGTATTFTIARSDTQEIRIFIKEYKGRNYIDVRQFFIPENSTEMTPTKKGIMLTFEQASAVANYLRELVAQRAQHQAPQRPAVVA